MTAGGAAPTLEELIRKHFGWLLTDHGFRITRAEPERIELESDAARVHVSLDRVNLFVDVEDPKSPGRIDLASIVRYKQPGSQFEYKWASNPQKLDKEARRLAAALKQHATDLLGGDFSQRAAIAAAS